MKAERVSTSVDMLRGLLIGVAVLGVLLVLFGGYRYLTARQILDAPEMRSAQTVNLDGLSAEQAQTSLGSIPFDVIRRHQDAEKQLNEGALIAGVGLIGLGAGWFGYDLVTRRKRRA